jgi:hypothetical protein
MIAQGAIYSKAFLSLEKARTCIGIDKNVKSQAKISHPFLEILTAQATGPELLLR